MPILRREVNHLQKLADARGVDFIGLLPGELGRALGEHHHAAQRDDGDHRFEQHGAVAHDLGVGFAAELLGGRAAGNERVKPEQAPQAIVMNSIGNSATSGPLLMDASQPRNIGYSAFPPPKASPNRARDKSGVQKIPPKLSPRLQQQPHGQHARHQAIGQQQNAPRLLGIASRQAGNVGQVKRESRDPRRLPRRTSGKKIASAAHDGKRPYRIATPIANVSTR